MSHVLTLKASRMGILIDEETACAVGRERGRFGVSHSFLLLQSKPFELRHLCTKLRIHLVAKVYLFGSPPSLQRRLPHSAWSPRHSPLVRLGLCGKPIEFGEECLEHQRLWVSKDCVEGAHIRVSIYNVGFGGYRAKVDMRTLI